jgi:arabinose-5-phosphate isomerase
MQLHVVRQTQRAFDQGKRHTGEQLVRDARQVIKQQAEAIAALAGRINGAFSQAVEMMIESRRHTIVAGVGKSGLIGKKIAATLASTGTPSFFLHPTEAFHGDLGAITSDDLALLLSYSGETEEIVRLIPHLRHRNIPIIAIVGRLDSTLGREADVALDASVEREVCPNNLAPTNSTLAALAIGDALAVSLMKERSFREEDFARFHPGGSLGRRLLTRVKDVMHKGTRPLAPPTQTIRETLFTITSGRLGLVLVMEGDKLRGIITDGDLRRAMQRNDNMLDLPIATIMTRDPLTINENTLVTDGEELMKRARVKALVAVDDSGKVSGVLDIFHS